VIFYNNYFLFALSFIDILSDGISHNFQFLITIIIIKLILLKIRVKTAKLQIYEWQRATASDTFPLKNADISSCPNN
jgi:hypothetical protein